MAEVALFKEKRAHPKDSTPPTHTLLARAAISDASSSISPPPSFRQGSTRVFSPSPDRKPIEMSRRNRRGRDGGNPPKAPPPRRNRRGRDSGNPPEVPPPPPNSLLQVIKLFYKIPLSYLSASTRSVFFSVICLSPAARCMPTPVGAWIVLKSMRL